SGGVTTKVSHWPATSSTTIEPASSTPLARVTCVAAHQPTKNSAAAASTSAPAPNSQAMIQAKGKAASEPHVPGITGSKPAPNQVAMIFAGWNDEGPGRCAAIIGQHSPLAFPRAGEGGARRSAARGRGGGAKRARLER